MRRIEYLIKDIRRISRNEANTDGTVSITDEEVLRYVNDAQDRAQGLLSNQNSSAKIFVVDKEIQAVANQDGYSLGDRLFYNKEFEQIEYSASGLITDYVILTKQSFFNRDTNTTTLPNGYYTRFGKFYPVGILASSQGKFRVMYERTLDDVDKRRGVVASVAGLTTTGFTSFVVDSTADETSDPNFSTIDYVCICDKDGNVKVYNIPVLSYNTGTNTVLPVAGFTFQTGETFAAGDFITFHKYTSTHSKLPDELERYLIAYGVESMLQKDSSVDVVEQSPKLQRMEKDFTATMASQTGEMQQIPTVSEEWY